MAKSTESNKVAGLSDEAVKAKTGKTWAEWLTILDKAGAKKMDHKGIVACLSDKHDVGSWWQQMIAVGYEQARGLREKHQSASGFSASASKTVSANLETLYEAWNNKKKRDKWLPAVEMSVRKATPNKSMRITWSDGTSVNVGFYGKGDDKSQVALQHIKLRDAKEVAKMKTYWGEALDRLKASL